jgi:shikimate dehydrogenase
VYYRLGLIGNNVAHSISPVIYDWGLRAAGLDGEYRLHSLTREQAQALIRNEQWHGLNVTTPHKVAAIEWCSHLSARAEMTGAVNTITRRNDALWGDNTDVLGFEFALKRWWNPSEEIRRALIVGSGGAARAVLVALGQTFAPLQISMACRNPQAARERLGELLDEFSPVRCLSCSEAAQEMEGFDLVIQATPVGGVNVPGLPLPLPFRFKENAFVFDLIYIPRQTPFLQLARKCSARTENGLVMLIAQAAASFEIWTGHRFPLEDSLKQLPPILAME